MAGPARNVYTRIVDRSVELMVGRLDFVLAHNEGAFGAYEPTRWERERPKRYEALVTREILTDLGIEEGDE